MKPQSAIMKRSLSLFASLLCLVLLLSCGQKKKTVPTEETPDDAQYQPTLTLGCEAPDFEVADTLGQPVRLSDYRGQYTVVEFWASWCGDCRRETPAVQALWQEYNPRGIAFIGVSFDHEDAAWRQYLAQNPFPYAQGSNLIKWKENPINEAYGLHWIPTFFLISPEGKVLATALTVEELKPALEPINKPLP